mgnify:CR=1 FL=1
MKKNLRGFFLLPLLFTPLTTVADWFGPSTFDECILESMKGVTSDKAALIIRSSCRSKFPPEEKKTPRTHNLSGGELKAIEGRGSPVYQPSNRYGPKHKFIGDVYNGNKNLHITSISIKLKTVSYDYRIYTFNIDLAPETTKEFTVGIDASPPDDKFSWKIDSARGY